MAVSDFFRVSTQLYIAYFARPADALGLRNFAAQMEAAGAPADFAGLSTAYGNSPAIKSLVDSLGKSAEANALYGAGDDITYVTEIYLNMLHRGPRFEGMKFWTDEIASGRLTRAELPMKMMAAAFSNTSNPAQAAIDQALINNKIAVALNFTSQFEQPRELTMYAGAEAASVARSMLWAVRADTSVAQFQDEMNQAVWRLKGIPPEGPVVQVRGTVNSEVIDMTQRTVASGMGGDDTFTFAGPSLGRLFFHPTITDLSPGDMIAFDVTGDYTKERLGAPIGVESTDYLFSMFFKAVSGAFPGAIRWFQFDGNTYVLNDASLNTDYTSGADQFITLVGTHDLSASTVSDTGLLTYIAV